MENNITFCAHYDLSDKARLFSRSQRREIKKLVSKLGDNDVVCIGTRQYKTKLLQSGDTITVHEARLDYMIDDTKHFCGVDEKHLMGSSFINIPANERKTRVKDESFRMITSVLSRLQPSRKSHIAEEPFKKMNRLDEMHNMKIDVRQWSRFNKTYDRDSLLSRLRNHFYEIKDLYTVLRNSF